MSEKRKKIISKIKNKKTKPKSKNIYKTTSNRGQLTSLHFGKNTKADSKKYERKERKPIVNKKKNESRSWTEAMKALKAGYSKVSKRKPKLKPRKPIVYKVKSKVGSPLAKLEIRKTKQTFSTPKKVSVSSPKKKPSLRNKLKGKSKQLKSKVGSMTSAGRAKKIGAAKGTKVSRGAVSVVKTKGGDYIKYKKDSKAAGSFRSAFKSKCSGGAKGFTWQGRKYSCAKK